MNPSLRGLIRRAEVIDLQFSETIRLAPMMRRLNPSARLVGTFHDVQSQLFGREVDGSPEDAAFWLAAADRARREEAKAVRRLDETLVFSAKDAHLLGDPRNARIVRPPLARGDEVRHRAPMGRPTICFVAHLARPENEQAVVWFLQEGWARVRAAIPEARWVIAGAGASAELVDRVSQSPGVDLAGYVPDLSQVYTEASVALIPLRQGAGLKFKTVEAMLAGVPLVTTSVGAEGVAPDHYFALVADRVDHLTSAVIDVLQKPEHHQRRADEAQLWAQQSYGVDAFKQHIRAAYGWV
jgi:glycosyltransferase involved in cell wall biosynthesis